jgi:DNA-binding transcriptional ArsR family regulator
LVTIREKEGLEMKEFDREKKVEKAADARSGGAKPYAEEDLISAINHPLRRQILRQIHSANEPQSPCLLVHELDLEKMLSQISYHVTVLSRYGVISLAGQRQVRGALEHFYASEVSDVAWLRGLLSRTREADAAAIWPEGRRGK